MTKEQSTNSLTETKNLVDAIIKKIKVLLDTDALRVVVDSFIRKNYNEGLTETEEQLNLRVNVVPNKQAIEFLSGYTFDNVKGMTDELVNKLRGELQRGLMNGEGNKALAERIRKVMDVGVARARTIARTESHRAYNAGSYDTAKQSGLKLKKYVFNPSPKTDICKHLVTKDPIGLDDSWSYKGEEHLLAPFHVNCRSKVLYKQVEDIE